VGDGSGVSSGGVAVTVGVAGGVAGRGSCVLVGGGEGRGGVALGDGVGGSVRVALGALVAVKDDTGEDVGVATAPGGWPLSSAQPLRTRPATSGASQEADRVMGAPPLRNLSPIGRYPEYRALSEGPARTAAHACAACSRERYRFPTRRGAALLSRRGGEGARGAMHSRHAGFGAG
jgi:hypothetical protein